MAAKPAPLTTNIRARIAAHEHRARQFRSQHRIKEAVAEERQAAYLRGELAKTLEARAKGPEPRIVTDRPLVGSTSPRTADPTLRWDAENLRQKAARHRARARYFRGLRQMRAAQREEQLAEQTDGELRRIHTAGVDRTLARREVRQTGISYTDGPAKGTAVRPAGAPTGGGARTAHIDRRIGALRIEIGQHRRRAAFAASAGIVPVVIKETQLARKKNAEVEQLQKERTRVLASAQAVAPSRLPDDRPLLRRTLTPSRLPGGPGAPPAPAADTRLTVAAEGAPAPALPEAEAPTPEVPDEGGMEAGPWYKTWWGIALILAGVAAGGVAVMRRKGAKGGAKGTPAEPLRTNRRRNGGGARMPTMEEIHEAYGGFGEGTRRPAPPPQRAAPTPTHTPSMEDLHRAYGGFGQGTRRTNRRAR
jgi:hypothetical protein